MLRTVLAFMVVVAAPGLGHAATVAETYAHFVGEPANEDTKVQGYTMPTGSYVTHVIIGQSDKAPSRLVVLHCDDVQCEGSSVWLGQTGGTIETIMVVDLAGQATVSAPARPYFNGRYATLPWSNQLGTHKTKTGKATTATSAALVITTMHQSKAKGTYKHGGVVDGTDSRGSLQIVNLAAKPVASMFQGPTIQRGATGAGSSTTYMLVRNRKHRLLDLAASEQRLLDNRSKCLPPDPVTFTFTVKDGRYVQLGEPPIVGGC